MSEDFDSNKTSPPWLAATYSGPSVPAVSGGGDTVGHRRTAEQSAADEELGLGNVVSPDPDAEHAPRPAWEVDRGPSQTLANDASEDREPLSPLESGIAEPAVESGRDSLAARHSAVDSADSRVLGQRPDVPWRETDGHAVSAVQWQIQGADHSPRSGTPPLPPTFGGTYVPPTVPPFGVAGAGVGRAPEMPLRSTIEGLDLLKRAKRPSKRGLRRFLFTASGGTINVGESPAEIEYRALVKRVNQPVRGVYKIAILSLKGGVGKTTTTVGLGASLASERGDRVIAVDANPDLGTLTERGIRDTNSTVRDLLADERLHRYSDVRAHTSQGDSRLEILASEQDPATAEAFGERDYRDVLRILEVHYNIILTDCGTGISHSAMNGVLDTADALIVVAASAKDAASSAAVTLKWLSTHGYEELVSRTVVVVNATRPGSPLIDPAQLERLFMQLGVRAVHSIPFDMHLAEGDSIELNLLGQRARRAFLELAAVVADGFVGSLGPSIR